MFNSKQDERKMALAITHYAYRNTALEDYHADDVKMDKAFYKKIYKIVYGKLKNAKEFNKYIKNYHDEINSKEEFEKLLNTVPEELQLRFLRYFQNIVATIEFRYGSQWEQATVVDCDLNGKGMASYVLSGHFAECCEKGVHLDDVIMCYINKDVHNRIYTLLVNGYFD